MTTARIPQRYDPAVPVDQLREHPANPRKGAMGRLDRSMSKHGFYGAVHAQEGTGLLVAGNHRHRKAVERGETTLPVLWLEVDDQTALELLLIDNWAADGATYDDRALLEALASLPTLDGAGYEPGDITDLEHLLDLGAWDDPDRAGPSGGGEGEPDELAMWPRIALTVPSEVFEAWTALLAGYDGTDDAAKLAAHLTETGHLS